MKIEGNQFSLEFLKQAQQAVTDGEINGEELSRLKKTASEGGVSEAEARFIANLDNESLVDQVKSLKADFNPNNLSFEVNAQDTSIEVEGKIENLQSLRNQANDSVDRQVARASELIDSGKYAEAEKLLKQVLNLDPDHIEANQKMSFVKYNQGDKEAFKVHAQKVLDQDPNHWKANYNLGNVLYEEGKTAEALPHLEKALAHSQDASPENKARLYTLLSLAYLSKGDPAKVLEFTNKALENGGDEARLYGIRAEANLALGNKEEAVADARKAFQIDGQNPRANYVLGKHYQSHGRTEEAQSFFNRAIKNGDITVDKPAQFAKTMAYIDAKQYDKAEVELNKILEKDPDNIEANQKMSFVKHSQGDKEAFKVHAQKVLDQDPNHWKANYNLGNVLYEEGKTAEALPHLEKALAHSQDASPENKARLYTVLSLAYLAKGDPAKVLEFTNKALENGGDEARLYGIRAEANLALGHKEEAVADARKAFQIDGQNPRANYVLGKHYQSHGRTEEARSFYNRAIENGDITIDSPAQLAQADAYIQDIQYDKAEAELNKILEKDPDNIEANQKMSFVKFNQGDKEAFKAHAHKILDQDPNHWKANYNLGNVLYEEGKTAEALPHLEKALTHGQDASPENKAKIFTVLSLAYFDKGDYTKALKFAQQALEQGSQNPRISDILAKAKEELDKS